MSLGQASRIIALSFHFHNGEAKFIEVFYFSSNCGLELDGMFSKSESRCTLSSYLI